MSDCPECESETEYPSVVWSFHVGRTGPGIGPYGSEDGLPEDEDEDDIEDLGDEDLPDEACPRCEMREQYAERLSLVEELLVDAYYGKLTKGRKKSQGAKALRCALTHVSGMIDELDGLSEASDD